MSLLVPAYPGCPGQKPLNGCVCVCVQAYGHDEMKSVVFATFIIPAKAFARIMESPAYVCLSVQLSVCLFVCLSVTTITK